MSNLKSDTKIITSHVGKHFLKAFVRTIPLIPGPELLAIVEDLKRSRSSIDEKINKAYESLKYTSQLIQELEQDMEGRTQQIMRLKEEYEKYSQVAATNEENAGQIIQEFAPGTAVPARPNPWVKRLLFTGLGIVLFALGVWLSPQVLNLLGIGL